MKYRKKPVVIEAIQWTGFNLEEIQNFVEKGLSYDFDSATWRGSPYECMKIKTLEGDMEVSKYDYIMKGVNGEFYPCKPNIFEKTYEIVDNDGNIKPQLEEYHNESKNKKLINTIVVNLFGEPSAGKSTCAMYVTAQLKRNGINAEYVSEFAKDKVYENNGEIFKHQEYIFGKQSFKMGRVRDKVQVMVVDSPLILSAVYNSDAILGEDFNKTVLNVFNSYNNRNYLLTRHHPYENDGRLHNEDEAVKIRQNMIEKLNEYHIDYEELASTEENYNRIVKQIMEVVKR